MPEQKNLTRDECEKLKACLDDPECIEFLRRECPDVAKGQGVGAGFDWRSSLSLLLDVLKRFLDSRSQDTAQASGREDPQRA